MNRLWIIVCVLAVFPVIGLAQEKDAKVYHQRGVVITASRQPESPGNVTQKIDVLSDSTLSTMILANRNVAEAIANQPGNAVNVLSRNDANWGTYGGIGPKYSTYMVQGLPVDAFVDPMALDLAAVERIEIQRGPASVLYPNYLSQDFAGNQSALTGTVNLIMRETVEAQKTILTTSFGSYNTLNRSVYYQDKSRNVNYFAGSTYETSDYTNYGTDPSWLNMKKDPEYTKTKLFGGATIFLGENDRHKVTLFVNHAAHNGDAGRVYRGFDHTYDLLNAGYLAAITDRIILQAHMGIRAYDRTSQESIFGIVDTLKSNNGVYQKIVPADIVVTFRHGTDNVLTAGSDYQDANYYTWSDPLLGYRRFGNKSRAKQLGVYVQEEYRIDGLTLRGGVRYAHSRNDIDLIDGNAPGKNSMTWEKTLWSAGVRYTMSGDLAVYANGGSSFIAPGLKSIGGTIALADRGIAGKNGQLPNPNLKPESGIGLDGGADAALPMNFHFGVRGFMLQASDAIVDIAVNQNPSQSQSVNAGKSTSTGAEFELRQTAAEGIRWFVNATYVKTNVENKNDADQDGTNVPFAPEIVANAGVDFELPMGLRIFPSLNFGGDYYDSNSKSGRKKFSQGAIVNLGATYVVASASDYAAEIFIQLYNLTDNKYEMPWQFKNPGMSVTGGLKVTL